MPLFSLSGAKPGNLGVRSGRLSPCPNAPNCVSSDADDRDHRVAVFEIILPAAAAWRAVCANVRGLPRTTVIIQTDDYLHAECRSALFGFVDDLELHLRPMQNQIGVRSAARLGYSDFGVNRRRVESLRSALSQEGVIR